MADPYIDNVDLLLKFDGVDGAKTTFAHVGSGAVVLHQGGSGPAELDTADKQFGTASLYTYGEGSYLEYGAAGDFDYLHNGQEDYTIEGFFKVLGTYKNNTLISTALTSEGAGLTIDIPFSTVGRIDAKITSNPVLPAVAYVHSGNSSIAQDTWYYWSLTHEVGVGLQMKLDAVTKQSSSLSSPVTDGAGAILMGHQAGKTNEYFTGWRDSIRITRGVVRTITTVPTADFDGYPPPTGLIAVPAALGAPTLYGIFDFTNLITDEQSFYVVEMTGDPVIKIPASSWQATIQTERANYVQCVIPAAGDYISDINARQGIEEFVVFREITINGDVNRSELARAPISTTNVIHGPTNYTLTMSGYAEASPAPLVPATREMVDVRSVSTSDTGKTRARVAIDWFLRPGDTAVVLGDNMTPSYINYYATSLGDSYMDIGER